LHSILCDAIREQERQKIESDIQFRRRCGQELLETRQRQAARKSEEDLLNEVAMSHAASLV